MTRIGKLIDLNVGDKVLDPSIYPNPTTGNLPSNYTSDIWEVVNKRNNQVTLQRKVTTSNPKTVYVDTCMDKQDMTTKEADWRYPALGTLPFTRGANTYLNNLNYRELSPAFRYNIVTDNITYSNTDNNDIRGTYTSKVHLPTIKQVNHLVFNAGESEIEWPEYRELYMSKVISSIMQIHNQDYAHKPGLMKGLLNTIKEDYNYDITDKFPSLYKGVYKNTPASSIDTGELLNFTEDILYELGISDIGLCAPITTESYSVLQHLISNGITNNLNAVPTIGLLGIDAVYPRAYGLRASTHITTLNGEVPIFYNRYLVTMFQPITDPNN